MTDSANEKLQQSCDELAAGILAVCETCGAKIACTESLTGGLLSDAFVRIPGASNVLLGSAVTYDIKAKARFCMLTDRCWSARVPCIPKLRVRWRLALRGYMGSRNTVIALSGYPPPG